MRRAKYKVVRIKQSKEGKISFTSCYAEGEYKKVYDKDRIVAESPSTFGIMVFDKKHQAESFIQPRDKKITIQSRPSHTLHIKRVLPIGRGKRPSLICSYQQKNDIRLFYSNFFDNNFEKLFKSTSTTPPEGTICYPAVEVLD